MTAERTTEPFNGLNSEAWAHGHTGKLRHEAFKTPATEYKNLCVLRKVLQLPNDLGFEYTWLLSQKFLHSITSNISSHLCSVASSRDWRAVMYPNRNAVPVLPASIEQIRVPVIFLSDRASSDLNGNLLIRENQRVIVRPQPLQAIFTNTKKTYRAWC